MDEDQLFNLYQKLKIPVHLVETDFQRNKQLLKQCFELGKEMALNL